jgi:hypothetical protein
MLNREETSFIDYAGSGVGCRCYWRIPYRKYRLLYIDSWWDKLLVLRGLAVYRLWRYGPCIMQGLDEDMPTPLCSIR